MLVHQRVSGMSHQVAIDIGPFLDPLLLNAPRPAEPCAVRAEEAPTETRPGSGSEALRWRFKCSKDKPPASFLGANVYLFTVVYLMIIWWLIKKWCKPKKHPKNIQKLGWVMAYHEIDVFLKVYMYCIPKKKKKITHRCPAIPHPHFGGWKRKTSSKHTDMINWYQLVQIMI